MGCYLAFEEAPEIAHACLSAAAATTTTKGKKKSKKTSANKQLLITDMTDMRKELAVIMESVRYNRLPFGLEDMARDLNAARLGN